VLLILDNEELKDQTDPKKKAYKPQVDGSNEIEDHQNTENKDHGNSWNYFLLQYHVILSSGFFFLLFPTFLLGSYFSLIFLEKALLSVLFCKNIWRNIRNVLTH